MCVCVCVRTLGDTRPMAQPQRPFGARTRLPIPRGPVAGLRFVPGEATRALPFSPGGERCVEKNLKDLLRSTVLPNPPSPLGFGFLFYILYFTMKSNETELSLGYGGGGKDIRRRPHLGQPQTLTSQQGYRMAQRESVPSLPSLGGRYGFVQRRGWTQMSTPSCVRSPCRNDDPKSST